MKSTTRKLRITDGYFVKKEVGRNFVTFYNALRYDKIRLY